MRFRRSSLAARDLRICETVILFSGSWVDSEQFATSFMQFDPSLRKLWSFEHRALVLWLTAWFVAASRSVFLAGVIAVVMLSSQSQTDRETTQQAPRYSSDSRGMPSNAA